MFTSIKQLEVVVVSIFLLTFMTIFSISIKVNWMSGQGDDAIYVSLLEDMAKYFLPKSQMLPMTVDFQTKSDLLNIKADDLKFLDFSPKDYGNANAFKIHFYLILYLLVPFVWLFPAVWVWAIATSVVFIGMLGLIYWFLRSKSVSVIGSVLFCLLISAHPAWNYSVQWQIYPDRLFMLFGLLLALLVDNNKIRMKWVVLVAVICAMIVEKTALITGMFIIGYVFLYHTRLTKKEKVWLLLAGSLIFIVGYLITNIYLENVYYSSFLTIHSFINFFPNLIKDPLLVKNLAVFLLFNGIFLLIFGVWEKKASLLAIMVMLPNIVGSIGGAEKMGWSTHYHSIYFPVLVWASAKGYVKLNKYIKERHWIYFSYLVLFGIAIVLWSTNPFGWKNLKFNINDVRKNAWLQYKNIAQDFLKHRGYYDYLVQRNNSIDDSMLKGTIVSAPEEFWVPIFEGRKVYYYPLGIDSADYVILRVNKIGDSHMEMSGYLSFLGADNAKKADQYLLNRMDKLGYDLSNPKIINNMAIIKRKKQP